MRQGQVFRMLLGILLIVVGVFLFFVIYVGSHGTLYFRMGHLDDWFTWGSVLLPILGGIALLVRWKR